MVEAKVFAGSGGSEAIITEIVINVFKVIVDLVSVIVDLSISHITNPAREGNATVYWGESQVHHAWGLGSSGGELLDFVQILASCWLVGELHEEIVHIHEQVLNDVEAEIVEGHEQGLVVVPNAVNELESLVTLNKATGCFTAIRLLLTLEETKQETCKIAIAQVHFIEWLQSVKNFLYLLYQLFQQ